MPLHPKTKAAMQKANKARKIQQDRHYKPIAKRARLLFELGHKQGQIAEILNSEAFCMFDGGPINQVGVSRLIVKADKWFPKPKPQPMPEQPMPADPFADWPMPEDPFDFVNKLAEKHGFI